MVGLAAGGAASLSLIPSGGFHEAGALLPATLAMTAGLLAGPAVAVLRSPRAVFRAEHLLSFGVFYWLLLDVLLGEARLGELSYAAAVRTFAAILAFALAMWVGSAVASLRPQFAGGAAGVGEPGVRFLFLAALAAGVLGLARVVVGCSFSPACMIEAFYQPRFSPVWFRIDAFGHFDTLFMYSRYFGFLVLPLTVALVISEGRFTRRSLITLALGLICLVFMVGDGGRKDVGTVVGSTLLVWALMKGRIAWRHLLAVGMITAALVVVMQFMLVARSVGAVAALERDVPLTSGNPVGTVDRNLRFLSGIVQLVPDRYPHNGWQGVAFALTYWVPVQGIPREWKTRSIDMPRMLGMSVGPGYSWTCSALGDLYLIGGLPVVLIGGALFGVLARLASRLMIGSPTSQRPILYALLAMTLFLSLRALHELFVTGFIVLAFALLMFSRRVLSARLQPAWRVQS